MQKLYSLPNLIVFLMIAASAIFMISAAGSDSAIFDETAHIVAGYNYLQNLDYRFNPEHPPLIKMLAGFPLLFQNLNFDTNKEYWAGINEQWWAGNDFLYKQGNDADKIIFLARLGPILITLLAIFFIYFWSKKLIGRWWALLPAFLFAFSPLTLAHGHYVTTDVGETLGVLIAIYYFIKYLQVPNRQNLIYASIAFGLAQAIKFSAVLLIPYFLLIAFIYFLLKDGVPFYKYLLNTLLIIIIGYITVVYPLYFIATLHYPASKQLTDTEFILQNFNSRPLADLNIQMSKTPISRPFAQYLLGILMVMQRSAGGNNAFFLGELSSHGWWYYFPLGYLMKEGLPTLFLIFLGGVAGTWRIIAVLTYGSKITYQKFIEYLTIHFTEFSLMIFILIYWLASVTSPLNIGIRHLLPTLPLIYILSAGSIKKWLAIQPLAITTNFGEQTANFFHGIFNFWLKTFILSLAIILIIIDAFLTAPYFLSYFNQLAGGKTGGYQYITDSNFDWGQDLKRLKAWAQINLNPDEKIAVDYFGGGDPEYYLGKQFISWESAKGSPKDDKIQWLAISINTLQGALAKTAPDFYRNPANEYLWLENPYNPADKAGTSIFLYKL
ncbi:MAG: glycosyltransferase family 39 protein [bacterium]|nr:glycosyltransferase family 39 protein [bacterium]